MPELQPSVTPDEILELLKQQFKKPILDLVEVKGSPIMRTFSFLVEDQEYLIRFNNDNMMNSNLPKEKYIWRKLAPAGIPVVQIIQTGRFHGLHFAISPRIQGQRASELSRKSIENCLPQLVEKLDGLRSFDVSDTTGYGVFDHEGRGTSPSWSDFLALISKEEDERDYFGKWYHLFDDTFLELDLFQDLHLRMSNLTDCLTSERFLVHGNYTLHNILTQSGRVVAILEWLDARYGDFLYDVASLDFWYPWLGVQDLFLNHYEKCMVRVPFYRERLLCYEYHIALGALRFFAYSRNKESYGIVRSMILNRIDFSEESSSHH